MKKSIRQVSYDTLAYALGYDLGNLPGVTIGDKAVVGAASVVTK